MSSLVLMSLDFLFFGLDHFRRKPRRKSTAGSLLPKYHEDLDKYPDIADKTIDPFRLLDLPVELQLQIFELAVLKPEGSQVYITRMICHCHRCTCHRTWDPDWETPSEIEANCRCRDRDCYCEREQPSEPPLCQVSRYVRKESLEVYYKRNELSFTEEFGRVREWLYTIGSVSRKNISNLCVQMPEDKVRRLENDTPWWMQMGEYVEGKGHRVTILPKICEDWRCGMECQPRCNTCAPTEVDKVD